MRGEFYQEGYDADFFAIDLTGKLVHFASGGNRIPKEIYMSGAWDGMMKAFFEKCTTVINPDLDSSKSLSSLSNKNFYLNSFLGMASRGLYSFDNSEPGKSTSFKYHLVACPITALTQKDMPSESGEKLVKLPINLNRIHVLDFTAMKLL